MNLETFVVIALVSSVVAFLWELTFRVLPAYKSTKIAESLAVLAKCVTNLNQDALLNAKIKSGHYLHDSFYKLIFCTLTHKVNLKSSMLGHIKYDEESEREMKKFRVEIDSLDEETKKLVNEAMFAVSKILIIRNPWIFISVIFKIQKEKREYRLKNAKTMLRAKMITSTELITVKAVEGDYSFA